MLDKSAKKPDNKVLELGCGHGWLCIEVAKRGINIDGFDISPKLIEMAKNRALEYQSQANFKMPHFEVRDLNKIILEPDSYDVVLIWDTLHHILEAERLLQEVKKGLKKGGLLVILEHIRATGIIGKILANIFILILPSNVPTITQIRWLSNQIIQKIIPRNKPNSSEPVQNNISPFEDITGIEMVDYIRKLFYIKKKNNFFSFAHIFVARIRTTKSIRLFSVRFFKVLDEILVRFRLLKGEYIFIMAVKP